MKKHGSTILLILILLIGLSLVLYPSISNWWNETRSSKVISDYSELVAEMDDAQYEQLWLRYFNDSLLEQGIITKEEHQKMNARIVNLKGRVAPFSNL